MEGSIFCSGNLFLKRCSPFELPSYSAFAGGKGTDSDWHGPVPRERDFLFPPEKGEESGVDDSL